MELPHDRRSDALHARSSDHAGRDTKEFTRSEGCAKGTEKGGPGDRVEFEEERGEVAARGPDAGEEDGKDAEEEVVLPQLRFNKDKRGYENTFVVQATGRRKGRSRILYWFRTPPGVRVGRGPLDEEAIRLLEAGNPDLEFDWTRILKGQGADEPEPEVRRERRERPRDRRPTSETGPAVPAATAPEPPEPGPAMEEPTTAAHARLGSEGLARLRARFCELLTRIDERVELDRREQLKELAERLNPDIWVTDADVQAGLESYEATFASLRAAIGPRRKPDRPEPAAETKD